MCFSQVFNQAKYRAIAGTVTFMNSADTKCDRQVSFSHTRRPDDEDALGFVDKTAIGQLQYLSFVGKRPVKHIFSSPISFYIFGRHTRKDGHHDANSQGGDMSAAPQSCGDVPCDRSLYWIQTHLKSLLPTGKFEWAYFPLLAEKVSQAAEKTCFKHEGGAYLLQAKLTSYPLSNFSLWGFPLKEPDSRIVENFGEIQPGFSRF